MLWFWTHCPNSPRDVPFWCLQLTTTWFYGYHSNTCVQISRVTTYKAQLRYPCCNIGGQFDGTWNCSMCITCVIVCMCATFLYNKQ
jgi:hypothetical protein